MARPTECCTRYLLSTKKVKRVPHDFYRCHLSLTAPYSDHVLLDGQHTFGPMPGLGADANAARDDPKFFSRGLGCHTFLSVAVRQLAPLTREMARYIV